MSYEKNAYKKNKMQATEQFVSYDSVWDFSTGPGPDRYLNK